MERKSTIRESQQYFRRHLPELTKRYRGEYIAIVGTTVVHHDADLAKLTSEVYPKVRERPIFIDRVPPHRAFSVPTVFVPKKR